MFKISFHRFDINLLLLQSALIAYVLSPRALPWAEFFSPLQGIPLTFNLYLDENDDEDERLNAAEQQVNCDDSQVNVAEQRLGVNQSQGDD